MYTNLALVKYIVVVLTTVALTTLVVHAFVLDLNLKLHQFALLAMEQEVHEHVFESLHTSYLLPRHGTSCSLRLKPINYTTRTCNILPILL